MFSLSLLSHLEHETRGMADAEFVLPLLPGVALDPAVREHHLRREKMYILYK